VAQVTPGDYATPTGAQAASAQLRGQFAVHRYLRLAEKTAVGFHWDW